jgi:hypothetical protein
MLARVPPETLGYIFRFDASTEVGDPRFTRISKDSYNFFFICDRRAHVARLFLELWNYWGKSLED